MPILAPCTVTFAWWLFEAHRGKLNDFLGTVGTSSTAVALCHQNVCLMDHTRLRVLQVPCGGCFFQDIQFYATAAGDGGCHLRVTAEVKFTKRVLGIGGLIRSSSENVSHRNNV